MAPRGTGRARPAPAPRGIRPADPVSCLTVTLRRGLGAVGSAALAALAALGVAACAAAAPAAQVHTATGAYHRLTLARAQKIYDSYVAVSDAAAVNQDEEQAESDVAFGQWSIVHSQYTALATAGTPIPSYRYGHPTFYVPTLATFPEWFVVAVPRTTVTGGQAGPTVNTVMLFDRPAPALRWALNGSAVLGQPLPPIVRDKDGYAIAVPNDDSKLVLRPDVVGATQSAVVDEGPASPAAAVIGAGPQTTGLYQAQSAQARSVTAQGLQYQWLLEGANCPQFELRTAGGGALLMYTMNLDTNTEHLSGRAGPPIGVPLLFSPLLASPNEVGTHGVAANWTYEYAAIDPLPTAHNAKVTIIGTGDAPTYGVAW